MSDAKDLLTPAERFAAELINKLEDQLASARKVIEFYAKEEIWKRTPCKISPSGTTFPLVSIDEGHKAREWLKENP